MRHLGVDYGSKKIGLALSDEGGTMGFPHSIIPNNPKAVEHICAIMAKEDVRALVIGDSVNYHGKANSVATGARELGQEVSNRCGVPVFYEWEGLTSVEARRAPAKAEKTRAPKKHKNVDASAAALILTSYLSRSDKG
ncbi:MAG: Holliday junction resolvase RuvX [bacterium]|nr:Holliday junction resolvase RuvX [bacterium]